MKTYQNYYTTINPSLFNEKNRTIKAKKIISIIKDFSKIDIEIYKCLEVGCSTGININYFSNYFEECIGIDIDENAVKFGSRHGKKNVTFIKCDAMRLPIGDNAMDVVVCNHVYEHVPDSQILLDEVFRVLKPGGFCYFAAGNKYSLIEGHYRLPFLSWLPKSIAHKYLQFTKRGTIYYENHLSYFQLKKLIKKFSIVDYTINVIQHPERFEAQDMIRPGSIIQKIPLFLLKGIFFMIPTYIFILFKQPTSGEPR